MLLRGIGVPRADRSVVILGAGASRGASFCGPGLQVLPPLDADFFRLAQHMNEADYNEYAKPVLAFLREDFGARSLPTLETVFTQLEGFERFLRQFSIRRGRRPVRYQKQLGYLQELIPAVFRGAFDRRMCDWHDRIAQALRAGDAVVSFNYDTLIDHSLTRWARGIWDARCGYGFDVEKGAAAWTAPSTPGPFPQEYLRLLKPHGSLHWTNVNEETETLDLRADAYAQKAARSNVIPPTWDKTVLGRWPWKPVWEESSRYLQRVRCLIVVGYSVPPTDLMSQALIKSSLSRAELRLLVVVNPDADARGRVIDLARAAIKPKTRVIELGALRDFALLLDETPDERRRRSHRFDPVMGELARLEQRIDDYRSDELWDLDSRVGDLEDAVEPRK
jgi:hypothetical protein